MSPKLEACRELVIARKACDACSMHDLVNPAHVADGVHDCNRIGPYSLWQGNLDARVMVVAQDFSNVAFHEERKGWPNPKARTNKVLVRLAGAAGLDLRLPRDGQPEDKLFFTNAVLCLKVGRMQARLPAAASTNCAERFLRPTIELVRPQAVVTLGRAALHAALHAFGLPRPRRFLEVVRSRRPIELPCASWLFPMCHPSPTVLNTTRDKEEQAGDWAALGVWLAGRRVTC